MNLKCVSNAAFTTRSRYEIPSFTLIENRDPVVFPPESVKTFVPLIRALSKIGSQYIQTMRHAIMSNCHHTQFLSQRISRSISLPVSFVVAYVALGCLYSIHVRAADSTFNLYAYGINISGLRVFYADGAVQLPLLDCFE